MTAYLRDVFCWILVVLLLAFFMNRGQSQEHHHSPQDQAIHEKFYSNWMMPDSPGTSCCHERDCYPTEARNTPNGWYARRREDGAWLSVPDAKIERNRDNPDGRNHLCAPPPVYGDRIYCFIIGSGT